jgi:predicted MFS family arabinose efflux permease
VTVDSESAKHQPVSLALGGLVAMAAAIGVGRFIYTPILPVMVEGLGLSKTIAGAIASANFAGYLLGAIVAASAGAARVRRQWLLAGLLASALGSGAMGWSDHTAVFFLLRFIGGFASALVLVFASSLVMERLAEAGRPGLAAIHFAGVGTGISISALLVSGLVAAGGDWRSLWWASGLFGLLALGAVTVLIPARVERQNPTSGSAAQAYSPALRNLVAAYGLFGFGYVITATFLVAIVRASTTLKPLEPAIWLVVGLAAAGSIPVWNRVALRIGNAQAFAWAGVLEALGVSASVFWQTPTGIVLCAVLLGGTFVSVTAIGLVEARRLAPNQAGRSVAVMTVAFGLGQILGPSFAGFLYDQSGSFLLPSLAAAMALITSAVLVMLPASTRLE